MLNSVLSWVSASCQFRSSSLGLQPRLCQMAHARSAIRSCVNAVAGSDESQAESVGPPTLLTLLALDWTVITLPD